MYQATKSAVKEKSKLKRLLKFLKQTINDQKDMGAENLSKICTHTDATYGPKDPHQWWNIICLCNCTLQAKKIKIKDVKFYGGQDSRRRRLSDIQHMDMSISGSARTLH